MDAGHEIRLLADGATLGSAWALGVRATALPGDIRGTLSVSGTASALARLANANTEAWMRTLMTAARGCDAILVSGLAAFVGLSVAEHFRIRAIGLGLFRSRRPVHSHPPSCPSAHCRSRSIPSAIMS